MRVLTRIRRILAANLNEALERAEDPARMLNYLILEMQESLEQAEQEVAAAMAAERRMAIQAGDAEQAADQWEDRARLAVERGNDDLAREAIWRKLAASELAQHYRHEHEQQATAVKQLRHSLDRLRARMEEARVRRGMLMAQIQTTHAQQLVARSVRKSLVGTDAFSAFDRLAGQVEDQRLKASAMIELVNDDVEDAFLVSEERAAIEHELLSMKRAIGLRQVDDLTALEDGTEDVPEAA